jgi:hypothetical protein
MSDPTLPQTAVADARAALSRDLGGASGELAGFLRLVPGATARTAPSRAGNRSGLLRQPLPARRDRAAIATNPEVIVRDEAVSARDVSSKGADPGYADRSTAPVWSK